MSETTNQLRAIRRGLENLLALRHSLEQQRLELDALAYESGSMALAELTEAQAETLQRLKRELSALWGEVNEAIK